MILGLLFLVTANAALAAGSWAILRRFRTGEPSLDALIFLLIRLLILSVVILIAGVTGTLSAVPLGMAGAAALAALLGSGSLRGLPLQKPGISTVLGVVLLVLAARFVIQVLAFSPHLGDPLTYHLPKVAEWIRRGGFGREMGLHPHVTFPAGFELVETWWVVFLRHDVLIEMAGLEFLVLGFAATAALARTTGLDPRTSWWAGVLYVLTPGIYLNAASCLNDAAVAGLVVATASLIAARASWGVVAVAVGLGIGVKPTFALVLPGLGLLSFLSRRQPAPASGGRFASALLGAAAVGAGAFWYLRNSLWFGNPLHPVSRHGYDHPVPAQLGPSLHSLGLNVSVLFNSCISDRLGAYSADVHGISGWGAVPFAAGLAALLLFVREDSAFRRLFLGFAVSVLSVFTLVKLDPWCMRFILFFPALLAAAAAGLSSRLRSIGWVIGAGAFFQFAATCLPYDLPMQDARELAAMPWRERSAASLHQVVVPPGQERVGTFGAFSGGEYLLYRPDFSRAVVHLRSTNPEELKDDLARAGLQYFYANPLKESDLRILNGAMKAGFVEKEGPRLYRVRSR